MKYTDSLKEAIKKDFPEFADMPSENILAYYEKGSFPELGFSILIFERDGRPIFVTTQDPHTRIHLPFDLASLVKNTK